MGYLKEEKTMANSIGRMEYAGSYKKRRVVSSSTFAGGYIPRDIPNKMTKTILRSALNSFLELYICYNTENELRKIKQTLEAIKKESLSKWGFFSCEIRVIRYKDYRIRGIIVQSAQELKLNFNIKKVMSNFNVEIDSKEFDFQNDILLKRISNLFQYLLEEEKDVSS